MRWSIFILFAVFTSCTYHQNKVEDLPEQAQEFISQHFDNYELHDIYFKNRHDDKIEVEFKDDTRVFFKDDGEWEQVQGGTMNVPRSILANEVNVYLDENYKEIPIVKVENKKKGVEVYLKNGYEIRFDEDGNVKSEE